MSKYIRIYLNLKIIDLIFGLDLFFYKFLSSKSLKILLSFQDTIIQ